MTLERSTTRRGAACVNGARHIIGSITWIASLGSAQIRVSTCAETTGGGEYGAYTKAQSSNLIRPRRWTRTGLCMQDAFTSTTTR